MNTGKKELFHAVSLSGGKDSTAMLILMVEKGAHRRSIDCGYGYGVS